ncbi:membrane protein [Nocardioides baekrokdamisoli]|uniref:Membrane protein n=1 Tax=Nocardioides baekrokdamisoli TaxID=1804624 RepID=A0A3G9ICG7_9ACTN|nr:hemolysin family protein [Nocardioides baekrokdamisoli]BBH16036.1 membrane protein [Nocardioides baekrokdamisoli]
MNPFVLLVVAVLLIAGNAVFVAAEFGLVATRRSQIEPLAQRGSRRAERTLQAMENMPPMIAAIQLGVTLCSVLLGAIAEPGAAAALHPLLHAVRINDAVAEPVAYALALAVVAACHVVLGEMVPKNLALAGPQRTAVILVPAVYALARMLRPLIVVLNAAAGATLWLFRIEPRTETHSAYTLAEIEAMVTESHGEGLLENDEYDRLAGALGFTEKSVDQILLPVEGLTTVAQDATGADVEAACAATGFSRFPVIARSGDLVGYLHIKDALGDEDQRTRTLDAHWIRPFAVVGVGEQLHDALAILRRDGAHMARVVSTDGDTLGVITLEDVIEELVGEIRDAAHAEEGL